MKKEQKLSVKLTIRIAVVLMVIFTVLIATITVSTNHILKKQQLDKLKLLAQENAAIAGYYMETTINKQEAIVSAIESIAGSDADKTQFVKELLESVAGKEENILGLFFAAEPNAFLPDTPDGFSIYTSEEGSLIQNNRFQSIEEESYREAVKNDSLTITDPIPTAINGKNRTVITIYLPVHDALGNLTGMVGSSIDIAVLMAAPFDNGGFDSFNNEIISGHKTVILNLRTPENIGKMYVEASFSSYNAYVPFSIGNAQVSWLCGASVSQQEFRTQILRQVLTLVLIAIAGLSALILFCLSAIRSTLKPLAEVETAIRRLADGRLDSRVAYHKNDEIGRLAQSFNLAVETISGYIRNIDQTMAEMAKGNFDLTPSKPFIGDFSGIEKSITSFIRKMNQTLYQMNQTALVVSENSAQLAENATNLSEGACTQAASVQELNAAISLLSEHVQSNDAQAEEASRRVQDAGSQLADSSARMREMTQAMNFILDTSREIQQVLNDIEAIAFQTNLLSLNAAIEAARAGASGKGFNVVAEEVRKLAAQSAAAAKSTAEMIQRSLISISDGAKLAEDASASLEMVQDKAASVVEIVDKICDSSSRQREEIKLVSVSLSQISEVVQSNSAAAEESAATAQELSAQAQIMHSMTEDFHINEKMTSGLTGSKA